MNFLSKPNDNFFTLQRGFQNNQSALSLPPIPSPHKKSNSINLGTSNQSIFSARLSQLFINDQKPVEKPKKHCLSLSPILKKPKIKFLKSLIPEADMLALDRPSLQAGSNREIRHLIDDEILKLNKELNIRKMSISILENSRKRVNHEMHLARLKEVSRLREIFGSNKVEKLKNLKMMKINIKHSKRHPEISV